MQTGIKQNAHLEKWCNIFEIENFYRNIRKPVQSIIKNKR